MVEMNLEIGAVGPGDQHAVGGGTFPGLVGDLTRPSAGYRTLRGGAGLRGAGHIGPIQTHPMCQHHHHGRKEDQRRYPAKATTGERSQIPTPPSWL